MTKITPTNNHLLIEPIVLDGFMATQRDTYQEIGVVVGFDMNIPILLGDNATQGLKIGNKVYFDSWLAAKYPKEGGTDDEFYWLVKWEDVRAIEYAEQPLSE